VIKMNAFERLADWSYRMILEDRLMIMQQEGLKIDDENKFQNYVKREALWAYFTYLFIFVVVGWILYSALSWLIPILMVK
jgi:hypothetical protein